MKYEYTKRYSQRYILKIDAEDIISNSFNINRTLSEFANLDNLISLSSNEAFRYFDRIAKRDSIEKDILSINKRIKRLKKLPNSRVNKSRINKEYTDLQNTMFIDEMINVQFNTKKEHKTLSKKIVIINGKKYKYYLGTSGGVKSKTIIFLREDIFENFLNFANNGRNENLDFEPSKLQAYLGLDFSGSIPLFNTRNILVVDDVINNFRTNVIQVKDNDGKEGRPDVEYISDFDYELNVSDGCGFASVDFMTKIQKYLDIDYLPSGMIIRNSFMKGVLSNFDFKEFAKDNNIKYAFDIWGKKHKIKDIDIVIPKSMFKMWQGYKDIDHYLDECDKNNRTLSVVRVTPKEVDDTANLNYQFINPLRLSDDEIEELIRPTIEEFKDILGLDINKSILYLNGMNLKEDKFEFSHIYWMSALFCNEMVINDNYIRRSIFEYLKKKINSAKFGEIKVDGNYTIAIGDPIMLAQSAFGLEIRGLLQENQIYSKYWLNKGVDKVGMFRPPMTSHYNIKNGNIACNDDMLKYYKHIDTLTIFNGYDTSCSMFNGMDFDGDIIFTTSNNVIVNNIKSLPAIECILDKASKKKATIKDFPKINENAMGNAIGSITNDGALLYHSLSKFEENSEEYKEIMYRIIITQLRQQSEIDSIKGVKKANINTSLFKHKLNKPKCEDDDITIKTKEFNRRILSPVKPLYFGYRYENEIKNYKKAIKKANTRSKILFNKDIEDLKNSNNEEELEFYELYEKYKPLDTFDSPMNKICKIFEKEFDDDKFMSSDYFDYTIYKSKLEYGNEDENEKIKNKIKDLYKKYRYNVADTKIYNDKYLENSHFSEFYNDCYKICNNKYQLTNIMLDIFYTNNSSKYFMWRVCADTIIENLLSKNNNTIKYPVQSKDGDLRYNGKNFKIISKHMEDELK